MDLTAVVIDTGPAFGAAMVVITGMFALWGIRKLIKVAGRS